MIFTNNFLPRIWANKYSSYSIHQGLAGRPDDCDCDCECYPRISYGDIDMYNSVSANYPDYKSVVFQKSNNITIVPLSNEYGIAYPKGTSGMMVVLNQDAVTALQLFSNPTIISDLCADQPIDPEALFKTAIQMLFGGLLESEPSILQTSCINDSKSLVAWLHITQECNLNCNYCYLPKQPKAMQLKTLYQAIQGIFQSAHRHGLQQVVLKYGGGEPTIHLKNILQAQQLAKKLAEELHISLQATLITNGTLITQDHVKQLSGSGIRISVSLDGLEQYHDYQRGFANGNGSFRHVRASIENMQKIGVSPHIIITVTGRNVDGLPALVTYLLEHNLTFNLNYYRQNNLSSCYDDLALEETKVLSAMHSTFTEIEAHLPVWSLLGRLLDRANMTDQHSYPCGVGRNFLVIDTQGQISKCQMAISHPVSSIMANDPLSDIRDDTSGVQNPSVDSKPGCQDCEWRYWCAGGCPLLNKRVYGSYDAKSPNCSIYRALFPEVLRLEALRLLKYEQPWVPL